MERMRMESVNGTTQNIEKLAALFPSCITETRGEDGRMRRAVNFEHLRQLLSEDVIEGAEAYEFTWVGKKAAMVEANRPIRKTLRPCTEESVNWDSTENLYIEGDNLDALKLLQENYLGAIDLIYIDPPYNTGGDLIYNDDFKMGSQEYSERLGVISEEGKRLFKNTDSNGRFHSDWCSMMYARLKLARNMLAEEGLIFISIDDNEQENLKKICDEVFGAENFINNIVVKMSELSGVKMKNLKKYPKLKEYLYIYCKDRLKYSLNIERRKKSGDKLRDYVKYYSHIVENIEDACEDWKISPLKPYLKNVSLALSQDELFNWKLENAHRLVYRTNSGTVDQYLLKHPRAPKVCEFINSDGKRIIKWENKELLILEHHMEEVLGDIWLDISTINLNKEIDVVTYQKGQKPLALIKRIIRSLPNKDIRVMDFFSGSATVGHAVMEVNAEDGGRRKFILVQVEEGIKKDDPAYKEGFRLIPEIGKERLRRAAKRVLGNNMALGNNSGAKGIDEMDTGFRVFRVDESNMNKVYYSPSEYTQDLLSMLESNIKADRTELDLLFGCVLDLGLPLSHSYSSEEVEGCTVHNYNGGELIACFNDNVPEGLIKAIARRKPQRVVFRDSCFVDSSAKINVGEVFKHYSPNTRIRVI